MNISEISDLKSLFPIFKNTDVIFLDTAASAQKPQIVIDAQKQCYENYYANIHRGTYNIASTATSAFEETRTSIKNFINANSTEEIIFTKNATEAINLVAYSYGLENLQPKDEILVTIMEHHSNLVPWQLVAKKTGATLKVYHLNEEEDFDLDEYLQLINENTKFIALTHLANGLGLEPPVEHAIAYARANSPAKILIDGAQIISHKKIDVQKMDCDFFAFSGHKLYGPSGVGVLYGKKNILEAMPPFLAGGEMVGTVSEKDATYNHLPYKFEAGTPNIADIIAFKSAIEFVETLGFDRIAQIETPLIRKLEIELKEIQGLRILGPADAHKSLICFVIDNISPYDLATFLDNKNIAIRVGHHCAEPLIHYLGYESSARISVGCYNTEDDINIVIKNIHAAKKFFG